jgi:hypothetical protein
MKAFDRLRYLKSQAVYWRYAAVSDNSIALPPRRALARLGGSPYLPPHDLKRTILVAVPKVGGNSLIDAIYGTDGARVLDASAQHKPALVFKLFDAARFADYFKIAFVRNPWDRLVSAYAFLEAGGKHDVDAQWSRRFIAPSGGFGGFVRRLSLQSGFRRAVMRSPHFIPQSRFVCDENNAMSMDFLGRFERMDEDFAKLSGQLGLTAALPQSNISEHAPYQDYYDDETRRLVGEIYAEDVQNFGYDFSR